MIKLEYKHPVKGWVCVGTFGIEASAWVSLDGDNEDYRTVNADTGKVLTDKSKKAD